ncbi:MAG: S8 family serine peptidase [Oscillospiraceae bacterium]|nr:S8 family serine peptidase [Oscillospiraceae bacterium]
MVKKRILVLTLLLAFALSLLPAAFAADSAAIQVFSVEPTEGVPYDGYLVSVRPGVTPRISLLATGMTEVVDDLYRADSIQDIQRTFRADQIVHIEPNYEITLFAWPNDPLFSRQWDMEFINATALWARGIDGTGIRVALLDSGINRQHQDLNAGRIAPGFNFVAGTTDTTDNNGHGTAVAGIIAAQRNNRVGLAGLFCQVTIVPLKIFEGSTSHLDLAVQAIYAAVDEHGADVINMSFGVTSRMSSNALEKAVNHAEAQGALLVAAVGNTGTTARIYPAAFPNVIGVGAVDSDGNVARFSQRNDTVHVTAPGVNIPLLGHGTSNRYITDSGTSFAAPYVTAMAAVARAVNPDITTAEFMNLLAVSAVPRGPAGYNTMFGHGTVDMSRFLAAMPGLAWFTDVEDHWGLDSILAMADLGLITGFTDGRFAPDQRTTRAQFVTMLGRLYELTGGIVPDRNDPFNDTSGDWYRRYVAWAAENGIVQGLPGGLFMPDAPVTRQQATTFLQRFAVYLGRNTTSNPAMLNPFIDRSQVEAWATGSMAWAVQQEIIGGINVVGGRALEPNGNATRAQVAVIFQRFIQNVHINVSAAA